MSGDKLLAYRFFGVLLTMTLVIWFTWPAPLTTAELVDLHAQRRANMELFEQQVLKRKREILNEIN